MKLLFLSFYFQPDLSAGSFRSTSLVKELKKKDIHLTILTTLPNRYSSFKINAPKIEESKHISLHRIKIPSHNSGMIDQIISFSTYYFKVKKLVKNQEYDGVYATSSRLFTAYLGSVIAKNHNIPLYLDIRDNFIESMNDILPSALFQLSKPILYFIEKQTFNYASHVNLVSKGFHKYFNNKFKKPSYSFYTNGIDDVFTSSFLPEKSKLSQKLRKTILYAGNIGEGQGLDKIVPSLAKKNSNYDFIIIGDGGKKSELERKSINLSNVQIVKPVNRSALLKYYSKADILFMHLNDYSAYHNVLPSKIFEYAATGKPILAGVSGYAKEFIISNVNYSQVFNPCDHVSGTKALELLLNQEPEERKKFINNFKRSKIMSEMSVSIINAIKK